MGSMSPAQVHCLKGKLLCFHLPRYKSTHVAPLQAGSPVQLLFDELNAIERSGGFAVLAAERKLLAVSITGNPSPTRLKLFAVNSSNVSEMVCIYPL